MSFSHIRLEVADRVASIVLANPDRMNVLGIGPGSSRDEIARAAAQADASEEVGCILIRAEGRAFCAGGDLSGVAPAQTPYDEHRFLDRLDEFYGALRAVGKPIVAAVNGLCLGAGLGLISQCDIVVCGDDARFGLIEGRIGHPGATEVTALIGAMWAKFLILTGELIDAERARDIGLVLDVIPADVLAGRAMELARRIASIPSESAVLNKAAISAIESASGRQAGRIAARGFDAMTKFQAREARAPDGRRFQDIVEQEGAGALKAARDQQFTGSWLGNHKGGSE